ncbi:DNA-formamidopyrimidine glycosylase family protein [Xanthomonas floridensis]|uniref:DNA-formamidopyrimidine glycosylase family protein n=1 Tax=Xanthomonas floridensis TaxID=1843580 RepID=A0A1A9M9C8_9XANT|nr:DNA-formamidopyrimidine glycosylase family protein [Xanthomonas floridensis]MEA5126303.1 DNA-formamidopyrimidine glycosylase family protein [Xanthomonas floridensis]MEA5134237.1 DNA-formamidopyrimidine glycosylase family protein [Xanthomonas floridensis]OAG67134.1 endonuclease [Xanthomonas floridensis]
MPEGPSLVILREEAARFVGRKMLRVSGNSKLDIARLQHHKVLAVRSWGKHLLIECAHVSVRIHFLLFGSYRINEDKPDAVPRLRLEFSRGERLSFYACSVQFIEPPLDTVYDWSADVMNPHWDAAQARRKLRAAPAMLAADALLNQDIFAGVGNIIKNEVLHRIRVHPESRVGALPARKLGELVTQAREYSFDFYTWKKAAVLKKHFQVHTRTSCPRDGAPLQYRKHMGKAGRRAFFCELCQRLYLPDSA